FWNITFRVVPQGLLTPPLLYKGRVFTMTFDFLEHQLAIEASDGARETIALEPRTVAEFYALVMAALGRMGITVTIWTMPVEVPDPIRFEKDTTHRSYDPAAARRFLDVL